jgi:hypothetical protein
MKIAIVGLGYVGLPLSLQFARSGVDRSGLDIDPAKVESLNAGQELHQTHRIVGHRRAREIRPEIFGVSTDFSRVKEVEAVIICVPTPLNKNREPDISYIIGNRQSHRAAPAKRRAGCFGIHDLSRHDRRGFARGAGSGFRLEGGRGFSSRIFAGARRPRQRAEQSRDHSEGHRRLHASVSGAPRRFTVAPSRRSCRFLPAARRRRRSCWKIFSAASTSRSSTN